MDILLLFKYDGNSLQTESLNGRLQMHTDAVKALVEVLLKQISAIFVTTKKIQFTPKRKMIATPKRLKSMREFRAILQANAVMVEPNQAVVIVSSPISQRS